MLQKPLVPSQQSFFDRCVKDRTGKLALAAKPNLPITTWFLARLLAWPLTGTAEAVARAVAYGALFTWAWLELFQGVNYFRRALGLVVLAGLIMSAVHK